MSLDGVRSESPDARYILALERKLRNLEERLAKLERDRNYLVQRVNRLNG